MLDANLKMQLKGYLDRLSGPVEIVASLDDSAASRDMRDLLEEIVSLSPMIGLEVGDVEPLGFETGSSVPGGREPAGIEPEGGQARMRPSFALRRRGRPAHVRFAGVPLGHEFTSLVLALLQAGGCPPKAAQETLAEIRALEGDHHFETFVSLSCQNCPEVVQALNLMAAVNPRIRHTMIDGALFQEEAARREVLAVPAVFLNGRPFGQGRMRLEEIVARLRGGPSPGDRIVESQASQDKAPYDVLVVGGGPAGAAAAIYAARKGIRTGIVAERMGGQLLDTVGVENFISVLQTTGHELAAGLEEHVAAYDVEVMTARRAEALVPGDLIEVRVTGGASLRAKSVIIATGARWREINVPGEREYRNRGVAYCPHCDGPLFKGRRVAVIGGGNSGVEAAIDLAGIAAHVMLIEYDLQLRADEVLKRKLRSLANVSVITGAQTTEIIGDGQKLTGLVYQERKSGASHTMDLAGVFVQIGLVPNTDWLKGTVKLSPRGEIEVDERGQTSMPGVFAAGDCTTVPFKQIVIASGEGAKAALSAFDHLIRSPLSAAA